MRGSRLLLLGFCALLCAPLLAQSERDTLDRDVVLRLLPRALPPRNPDPVRIPPHRLRSDAALAEPCFPSIARRAGIIFSGTVIAISRDPATLTRPIATVTITFHVEKAIRGATPGQDLTISQWIGLWSSGQRYRVGERVLLFLYPPSRLGLTSLVGGEFGRFSIDARGGVLLSPPQFQAFRGDPILGGRTRVLFSNFVSVVRRSGEE